MSLIECVPNISEGRRPEVVAALVEAVRHIDGVHVLDVSSDPNHHRTVVTLAGLAPALRAAVLALVETAVHLVDLRTHHGVHPRLGAVDVVPFVPLSTTPMDACVTLARETAAEIAERFSLPVYLYEEAAIRPARRKLEDIRRGQFEGLPDRLRQPDWAPDFGPSVPHPSAGATVVGARRVLVAYNVNLATADVGLARRIASTIRERDGGLPFVKAMGVALASRGVAQVSMNLTNIDVTPIPVVFEAVRREAHRLGTAVLDGELVGLAPRAAFGAATPADVGLGALDPLRLLDTHVERLTRAPAPASETASPRPRPSAKA